MAIYGYIRCSLLKRQKSSEVQQAQFGRKAEELGQPLVGTFVDPGDSRKKTAILNSATGKEMLEALRAGDTLIVTRLDRLGYSMRDLQQTIRALCDRGVRIYEIGRASCRERV